MAGPAQLENNASTRADDGKWEHHIRQSWLGTVLDVCPEQARLDMHGELPRIENDATSIGTCVHAAIEGAIDIKMDPDLGFDLGADDVVVLFDQAWAEFQATNQITWVKRTPDAAEAFGRNCARIWAEHVLPTLEPLATELHFSRLLAYEDDHRRIYLSGTMDYVDRHYVGDWKTAGQPYKPWEKQRWAIQPTVYWFAINNAPECRDIAMAMDDEAYALGRWKFIVMPERATEPQIVECYRPVGWEGWMVKQLVSVAKLMEADLDVWPLRDQHALCGPKWCPVFAQCKGPHVNADWALPVEFPVTQPTGIQMELAA